MAPPARYELWRQDDNGNCFLVASFSGREAAEQRLAKLTRFPHNQTYWIVEQISPKGER